MSDLAQAKVHSDLDIAPLLLPAQVLQPGHRAPRLHRLRQGEPQLQGVDPRDRDGRGRQIQLGLHALPDARQHIPVGCACQLDDERAATGDPQS